jgi:hypothetical protein
MGASSSELVPHIESGTTTVYGNSCYLSYEKESLRQGHFLSHNSKRNGLKLNVHILLNMVPIELGGTQAPPASWPGPL